MATATLQFVCQQCGKKYSTPANLAGKLLTCTCGTKLSVPSAQSAPLVPPQTQAQQYSSATSASYSSQAATASAGPAVGFPNTAGMPPVSGSTTVTVGPGGSRREFPALRFVAKITDIISWIYIIGGVIAAIGVIAAAGPGAFAVSLLGAVALVLVVMLAAVFIRAMAEMIRLALYIAELLEDVRANTR